MIKEMGILVVGSAILITSVRSAGLVPVFLRVWSPDMTFVIIMDEITLCCEETQGFALVYGDFVF